jgi:transposase
MALKKLALQLYVEGLGFRSIGRILKVSQVSIMNWIKKFGEMAVDTPELVPPSSIIEMDEIHTYVREKKTTFGFGLQLTDSERGLLISRLGAEPKQLVEGCLMQ